MRPDTQAMIDILPKDRRKRAMQLTSAFEELESRLSPEREVRAALASVVKPIGGEAFEMQECALIISDYGFHILGDRTGRLDLPWDDVLRSDIAVIPLSMIRKSKRAFQLQVETREFALEFHLFNEETAYLVKSAVDVGQPLL